MAKKLIGTYSNETKARTAKVYHDSEYGEYAVKFYCAGLYQIDADYFTSDRDDAIGTANHWTN